MLPFNGAIRQICTKANGDSVTKQLRWLCLALAAAGISGQASAQPATPPAGTPPTAAPAAPVSNGIPVTVTKPSRQDVPVFLRGLGLVAASKTVIVRPRVDGTIDRVAFTEGDEIAAGTLLAQLDPRPYQAVLDQALAKKASDEANLANAKLDLRRSTQLASNQFAAQQTVDTRAALVAQLEATIKGDDATISAARLNLEFTRITAPFDGRVGLRLVDQGNFVRAADNTSPGIVSLSQIRPISVTFTVAQDNLPDITGAMARGKPPVIAWSADDKALTIPSAAVQRGPAGLFVYVVKSDQTVAPRPIDVVQDTGVISVVTKGLADDETVVLSGQSRLNNGAKVAATVAPAS
eukprot:gene2008-2046_t